MTIEQLVAMCKSRLANLSQLRSSAVALGDADQVARIDGQIDETQTTLNKLLTLA
jgi:hypothetical protein